MRLKMEKAAAAAGLSLMLTASFAAGAVYGTEAAGSFLTEQEAEELALTDAGALKNEAERVRTKTDFEDGESVYEVEFYLDRLEYDYTISQETGLILQWSVEGKDAGTAQVERTLSGETAEEQQTEASLSDETEEDPRKASGQNGAGQASQEAFIGIERAKELVLADAGLTEEEVVFTSLSFDREWGYGDYELEFRQDRREYEYTVDAATGEILSFEQD